MDDRPVINIGARRVQAEYFERWNNWQMSYFDWIIKVKEIKQLDRYNLIKENPQYNRHVTVMHFDNLGDFKKAGNSPESKAFGEDQDKAWADKSKVFWYAQFQLIDSFRDGSTVPPEKRTVIDTKAAPIIHFEGYDLGENERSKYNAWIAKWGHEVYIRWLTKLNGLVEYDRYEFLDIKAPFSKIPRVPAEYPPYLSILHFKDIDSYENYERSPELAAFREAMKVPFPQELEFKWYVQYQLVKSWRK